MSHSVLRYSILNIEESDSYLLKVVAQNRVTQKACRDKK